MGGRQQTILLVEQDLAPRELIGGWLEDAGYTVMLCPGPRAPDYSCIGGRGGECPLATAADMVVLDLQLAADSVGEGVPAHELLGYYLWHGKPVVALAHPGDSASPYLEGSVTVLRWPPDRSALLEACAAFPSGTLA